MISYPCDLLYFTSTMRYDRFRVLTTCSILTLLLRLSACTDYVWTNAECKCERIFRPVCGSDTRTYDNICQFNCQTRTNHETRLLYEGACCPMPSLCPPISDPVCDDQGETHVNECTFLYKKCLSRRMDNKILSIVNRGACQSDDPCKKKCDPDDEPVCNSVGETHMNMCSAIKANCERVARGEKPRTIAHVGICDSVATGFENGSVQVEKTTMAEADLEIRTSLVTSTSGSLNNFSTEPQEPAANLEIHLITSMNISAPPAENVSDLNLNDGKYDSLLEMAHAQETIVDHPANLSDTETTSLKSVDENQSINPSNFHSHATEMNNDASTQNAMASTLPPSTTESLETTSEGEKPLGASFTEVAPREKPGEDLESTGNESMSTSTVSASGLMIQTHAFPNTSESISDQNIETDQHNNRTGESVDEAVTGNPSNTSDKLDENTEFNKIASMFMQRMLEAAVNATDQDELDEHSQKTRMISDNTSLFPIQEDSVYYDDDWSELGEIKVEKTWTLSKRPGYVNSGFEKMRTFTNSNREKQSEVVASTGGYSESRNDQLKEIQELEDAGMDGYEMVTQWMNKAAEEGSMTTPSPAGSSGFEGHKESEDHLSSAHMNRTDTFAPGSQPFSGDTPESLYSLDEGRSSEPSEFSPSKSENSFEIAKDYSQKRAKIPETGTSTETSQAQPYSDLYSTRRDVAEPLLPSDGSRIQADHSRSRCGSCAEGNSQGMVPVCDNFNLTHRSLCHFTVFNCGQRLIGKDPRSIVHVGPCRNNSFKLDNNIQNCPAECSREYQPVCDSHGTTHPNLCAFRMYVCRMKNEQLEDVAFLMSLNACSTESETVEPITETKELSTKSTSEEQPSSIECPMRKCSDIRSPVCDDEGKLHHNECTFALARCKAAQQGKTLLIMPVGDCEQLTCSQNCSNEYHPVCASNFITYPNRCFFHKASCVDDTIDVLFNGECRDCLPAPCPEHNENDADSDYVCDQDGETKSKCEFDMLKCIYGRKYGYDVPFAYEGRCCSAQESCPDDGEAICDSDGAVHKNLCSFEVAKCRAFKIERVELKIKPNDQCEALVSKRPANTTVQPLIGGIKVDTEGESACQHRACTQQYDPVCGTDSITYPNECMLHATECDNSIPPTIAYRGACCSSSCPSHWQPVCDSRNVTYENICEFGVSRCLAQRLENLNITISRYDACESSPCSVRCAMVYDPVCASNGATYRSECELNNAICVRSIARPVKEQLHLEYRGECCGQQKCSSEFRPVCDQEGVTHTNPCEFMKAACVLRRSQNRTLTIAYDGQCCDRHCDMQMSPVCSEQGVTYDNVCKFRVAECEAERKGGILSLGYTGRCCEQPEGKCAVSGAVCDSEGQTHMNMCTFLHKQCVRSRVQPSNYLLSVIYRGECCVSSCGDQWEAVCDQDGNIYKNKCFFEVKRCETQRRHGFILRLSSCVAVQHPLKAASDSQTFVPSVANQNNNGG